MKGQRIVQLSLFSLVLGLSGCDTMVSMPAPPRVEETTQLPEAPSTIIVPVSVSLTTLRSELEGQVDKRLVSFSENREDCTPDQYAKTCLVPRIRRDGWKLKKDGCSKWASAKIMDGLDCRIEAHADRGEISVKARDNIITVGMPVSASATVRGRGEALDKIRETVSGSVNATAAIAADIDEQWQPTISITPDFSWRERANLRVLGFEITVGSHLEPEIKNAMSKVQSEVDKAVEKFALRAKAESLWNQASLVTKVSSNPDVWFRFVPQEVGFSGITSTEDSIELALMVSGKTQTFVGPQPSAVPPPAFPPLKKSFPDQGFNLYLPLFADYASLETALGDALKLEEEQEFEVPNIGNVPVIFKAVTVYPTQNNSVAIGLKLEANPPKQFFDTKGTIWIKARLDVDSDNLRITPTDLDYGAESDNAATNLLVAIARLPAIRKKVETMLAYDFTKEYEKGLKAGNAALNRNLGSGLVLEGSIIEAGADDIKATANGIYLGMFVSGTLGLRMSPNLKPSP